MSSIKKYFPVFICFETYTGSNLAENLKLALERIGIDAFVSKKDIEKTVVWQKAIDKALEECIYFIPILTNAALMSEAVKEEIEFALKNDKKIIPCFDEAIEMEYLEEVYEPLLEIQGILYFNSSEDLNKQITDYMVTSEEFSERFVERLNNLHRIVTGTIKEKKEEERIKIMKEEFEALEEEFRKIEPNSPIEKFVEVFKEFQRRRMKERRKKTNNKKNNCD
ncbi:MAG: TIR domain-containing protein [Candidatus Heimdallarchaeota archaeon]|nr:TIR domain-containing protein [Candidatus Heimdallarchaeota archaeon]